MDVVLVDLNSRGKVSTEVNTTVQKLGIKELGRGPS